MAAPPVAPPAQSSYDEAAGYRSSAKAAAKGLYDQSAETASTTGSLYGAQQNQRAAAQAKGNSLFADVRQKGSQVIHGQQAQGFANAAAAGGMNNAGSGGQYGAMQSAARQAGLDESGFQNDVAMAQNQFDTNAMQYGQKADTQGLKDVNEAKEQQYVKQADAANIGMKLGTEQDVTNQTIGSIQKDLKALTDTSSIDYDGLRTHIKTLLEQYGSNPAVQQYLVAQLAIVNKADNEKYDPFSNKYKQIGS